VVLASVQLTTGGAGKCTISIRSGSHYCVLYASAAATDSSGRLLRAGLPFVVTFQHTFAGERRSSCPLGEDNVFGSVESPAALAVPYVLNERTNLSVELQSLVTESALNIWFALHGLLIVNG
jgi:hypothetical protein